MRRLHSISELVYRQLFPHPSPKDPPDFDTYLHKYLVPEVRIETQRFYGGLETVEARYPGLNYSHPPHRKRLSRFPHHARLFRAFDELGLTEHEIGTLCLWEGTLWARQRYERDEGIRVVDTTGNEILPWVDRRPVVCRRRERSGRRIKVKTDIEVEIEDAGPTDNTVSQSAQAVSTQNDEAMEDANTPTPDAAQASQADAEDSDDEVSSVGLSLNARLIAAIAAREQQGNSDIPLDPAWEAYLKEAAENGTPPLNTLLPAVTQQALQATTVSSTAVQANQAVPEAVPMSGSATAASTYAFGSS